MNKRQIAEAIYKEAKQIGENALSDRYNVFVLKDGTVQLDPVTGPWGAGIATDPEGYIFWETDVPLGWLTESVERVLETLLD